MTTVTNQQFARHALERGVNAIVNTIKLTLGPAGRNVVLSPNFGKQRIVNDGVTIAREIELANHAENLGVGLIRDVCVKTHDAVGDGTTTAAVLAQAMISEGLRNVAAGANPVALRRALEEAASLGIETIKSLSKPVEGRSSIVRIATLSAGNDESIGNTIADAVEAVGKEGIITIEESKSVSTTFERASGMRFEQGFISPYFVTDTERMESVLDEPLVLCIDQTISIVPEMVPVLEQIARLGRPLLIVAHGVAGEALTTLVLNHLSKVIICCAVSTPSFGEGRKTALADIAALTGSEIISEERGMSLENVTLGHLGKAQKVQVTETTTTIVADAVPNPKLQKHVDAIKYGIENTTNESEKRELRKRLGRLSGGIGVIKVGAHTETELHDRKLRFENALNASLSAMEDGYVAGGGTALVRVSQVLKRFMDANTTGDRSIGFDIVRKSFETPLNQIASNAGLSGKVVVQKVKDAEGWFGFDALSVQYVDTGKAGIIDSAKVVKTAIQNAASVAALVLTTGALVAESSEHELNQSLSVKQGLSHRRQ